MSPYVIPGLKFRELKKLDEVRIIETICKYFNVKLSELEKKSHSRRLVIPRQLAMYFMKKYTNLTLKTIGNLFGGRDHTTVLHSLRTINDFIYIKDGYFLKIIFEIEQSFLEKNYEV